jgi:hypothetical protein
MQKSGAQYYDLDEDFTRYKQQLHAKSYYTYTQMVDNILLLFKELILYDREIDKLKTQIIQKPDLNVLLS